MLPQGEAWRYALPYTRGRWWAGDKERNLLAKRTGKYKTGDDGPGPWEMGTCSQQVQSPPGPQRFLHSFFHSLNTDWIHIMSSDPLADELHRLPLYLSVASIEAPKGGKALSRTSLFGLSWPLPPWDSVLLASKAPFSLCSSPTSWATAILFPLPFPCTSLPCKNDCFQKLNTWLFHYWFFLRDHRREVIPLLRTGCSHTFLTPRLRFGLLTKSQLLPAWYS